MSDDLLSRLGAFSINASLAKQRIAKGLPLLPQGTSVVRCDCDFACDTLNYVGYHRSFMPIPEGGVARMYEVRITALDNGQEAIYFV